MNEQTLEENTTRRNWRVIGVTVLFAVGLVAAGVLRFLHVHSAHPVALTSYATELYIGLTVFAAIVLTRSGVPFLGLGFGPEFKPVKFFVLAALGVGLIQLAGIVLGPIAERVFGEARDLTRFSDVAGSQAELIKLMVLNWTVAAFGEELAFRIVLMRAIAFVLGDNRRAFGVALIVQAVIFGLVHAYQGPTGIFGTAISGLVYGGLTLAARGSIWPAAIAHGSSNSIGIMELYLAG